MTKRREAIPTSGAPGLKRSLSLGHATLYGLGVTVGAGIYVLIGAAAAHSAMHAPAAFAIAALLMALTAASFAELVSRAPVAAGEAAYVALAFHSNRLTASVGLLVTGIAVISAATISVGAAGYIAVFLPMPAIVLVAMVVLTMGGIAAWGIKESVMFVRVMTLIEVGGLVIVILAGMLFVAGLFSRLPEMVPPLQAPGNPDSGRNRRSPEVVRQQKGVLSNANLESLRNGHWKGGWDSTVRQIGRAKTYG